MLEHVVVARYLYEYLERTGKILAIGCVSTLQHSLMPNINRATEKSYNMKYVGGKQTVNH